jgi:6,7-dimethyl-8-ribityllumazine synthase
MATKYQNLSDYDASQMPPKTFVGKQHFALIVSDWNPTITHALLKGAFDTLIENGAKEQNIDIFHVPGTFELTYAAKRVINDYSAIIVMGCVIQGETPHFDYVCQGVTQGITELNLEGTTPIIFSVLTTNTMQQAVDRSGGIHGNKGTEGAITAIKMIELKEKTSTKI